MSDEKPSQTMTAEDVGAVLTGFALSLTAAMMSPRNKTPNQVLDGLVSELRDLVEGMSRRGDQGTPAAEALQITAAMLEASAPKGE